jgi:hypothetical protein
MSFIRQIAIPVLLTVFGTVAFLGTGLHLIPGCGHFHVHAPWQQCADHLHAGHQHEKASHQHGFGTSHDDCAICRFLGLPRLLTSPPTLADGGNRIESIAVFVPAHAAREAARPYSARAPPCDSSNA